MSKPKKHKTLADMSLDPADRARGRKPGITGTPPAQMSHAQGSRARRQRRDGERWLTREEVVRFTEEAADVTLDPWQQDLLDAVFSTDGPLKAVPYRRQLPGIGGGP